MNDLKPGVALEWLKSSYSGNDPDKSNCVEVAFAAEGAYVRDSKDPGGGKFHLTASGWQGLLVAVGRVAK